MLSRIGDKWTVQIVVAIHRQPRRFNAIKRLVPAISQQMLTRTLKALERDGLVKRVVHDTTPPQVEYSLTSLGISLSEPLRALAAWAIDHRSSIRDNRHSYDDGQ
ncbi:helix-turn-helix domain-containing protein [Mesorhizobium sp.]|uniref:winged helix-turn-helix transcriptional regulator n=1 Tax=Mesorhizobium sp. TaxID=1871066 RepID=UPI00345AB0EA